MVRVTADEPTERVVMSPRTLFTHFFSVLNNIPLHYVPQFTQLLTEGFLLLSFANCE